MHDLEVYPFWQMRSHQRVVVRFVPDLNEHNTIGFIDEYHFHQVEIDGKPRMALCSLLHEDNQKCYHCIIAKRAFNKGTGGWNDDARKYWRNRQYVGNVIIIEDPLDITDPKNPKTYKLPIGKQLFNDLKDGILGNTVKEMPSDFYNGNNFVITRELMATYPKYTGSFQRKSRLTSEQIELAEESMIDLSKLRPTLYSSKCQDELSKDLCWEILGNV